MIKHFIVPCFTGIFKLFLLIICVSTITLQMKDIGEIWKPVKTVEDETIKLIKQDLRKLGVSNNRLEVMSKSIKVASEVTNIDDRIITTVISEESNFKLKAVSSKGYKGLMQTRVASMEHPEVDIMMGAKELEKWLKYRHGDLKYALASYNGGTNPPKISWTYAENVIRTVQSL